VVSEKASKQLVDACENSRVEYHEGGELRSVRCDGANFRPRRSHLGCLARVLQVSKNTLDKGRGCQTDFSSYITTVGNGGSAADVAPLAGQETARL
jgi:hypothetical protein